jgi:hypothetical protein
MEGTSCCFIFFFLIFTRLFSLTNIAFMKNKLFSLAIIFSLFFISISVAQIDSAKQNDDFFEDFDKPMRRFKLGGAGGFTMNYLFINTKDLNTFLALGKTGQLSEKGMFLYGGEGYGYVMFLKNIRMGGMGASGTLTASSPLQLIPNTSDYLKREVQLDVSYGGFLVGYSQPILPRLDIALDVMIGGGEMNLQVWRTKNPFHQWDSIWTHIGNPQYNETEYSQRLDGEFFTYQVSLNIEYAMLQWLGVRVGAGYSGMTAPEWKLDEKYSIDGVPTSISAQGFAVNFGIFAGFFGD